MKKKLYVFMMMLGFIIVMLGVKGEGCRSSVSYAAQDTRTGVYQAKYTANGKTTTEWCYLKNGVVQYNYNGFQSNSNGWWYIEKGKVTFKKTDIIQGTVKGQNGWWYVKDSKVQFVNSVEQNSNGWWVIRNGKVDFNYTGFADNSNGWWYIEKGKVTFKKTDVIKGTVKGQSGWWFVKGSRVKFVNSVEQNSNGWWVIRNGKVDFNYTGFADNSNGWWYAEKGKITFKKTDVIQGTVKGQSGWWYVKGSRVQFVDSVEKNSNGWWVIRNGKVDFSYNGFAKNSNGWWYCKNGKVDTSKNCFIEGTVNGKKGWWYCLKGKVDIKKKDIIQGTVKGKKGLWFVKNGKVQFVDSVEKSGDIWWFINNGMVDKSFTGIAKNSDGWWYCKKGKVYINYNGFVELDCSGYVTIKNGKVVDNDGCDNMDYWMRVSNYLLGKEVVEYSYEVTPLLYPLNDYFFIKTDNPDPDSFYFVDKSTKYSDSEVKISPTGYRFSDVKYENKKTGRVKGGYIAEGSFSDGGTLYVAEKRVKSVWPANYDESTGVTTFEKWYEPRVTEKTIKVKKVKDSVDYIIDTYTNSNSDFFEKLSDAQYGMALICLYSGSYILGDLCKDDRYPYYGISNCVYAEQNFTIDEPYKRLNNKPLLMSMLYPYRLDSIAFPSMVISIAERMDPSVTYEWSKIDHSHVYITHDGVTKGYGGSGFIEGQGLQENQILYFFTFDMSESDASTKLELEIIRERLVEYGELESLEDVGKTITPLKWIDVRKQVGEGSYAKIRIRNASGLTTDGTGYTYLYDNGSTSEGTRAYASIGSMENVWFDGRYFTENEFFYPGKTFEETIEEEKPSLVFKNYKLRIPDDGKEYYMIALKYEDGECVLRPRPLSEYGYDAKTGKWNRYIEFTFDEANKYWYVKEFRSDYSGGIFYYDEDGNRVSLDGKDFLDSITITMDEAKAMKLDKNTNKDPSSFLIYDRVTKPGTKGSN